MIDGVILKGLKSHYDDRGFFKEIFRFPEEFPGFPVGQLSHSLVNQGVIKAWHGHKKQAQWNYLILGRIRVALHDSRQSSRSFGMTMEFELDSKPGEKAYFFPPGVLHGYKCLEGPMHIIYLTSGIYDPQEDEVRVPHDTETIVYHWEK